MFSGLWLGEVYIDGSSVAEDWKAIMSFCNSHYTLKKEPLWSKLGAAETFGNSIDIKKEVCFDDLTI